MAKYSYESYVKAEADNAQNKEKHEYPRVGYFYLNEEKPTAIVRFDVSSGDDLTIVDVHNVKVGNSWRNVACLRDNDNEQWSKCPLCETNIKSRSKKVFVRMLEYVIEEGKVVVKPVVWTRYSTFADELMSKLKTYGDLKECLFKVTYEKKNGKGSYTVDYLPDRVGMYTEEAGYKKDFSAFNNFLVNKHSYMERTFEELKEYVKTGEMASRKPADSKPKSEDANLDKVVENAEEEKKIDKELGFNTEATSGHVESSKLETKTTAVDSNPAIQDNPVEEESTPRRRRYADFTEDFTSPF